MIGGSQRNAFISRAWLDLHVNLTLNVKSTEIKVIPLHESYIYKRVSLASSNLYYVLFKEELYVNISIIIGTYANKIR